MLLFVFSGVAYAQDSPTPEAGGNPICKGWQPKDGPKQCPVTGDDGKVDVNGECVGDGVCQAVSYVNENGEVCSVATRKCTDKKSAGNPPITIEPTHAIPESSLPPFTTESVREAVQNAPENMGQDSITTPTTPDFKDIVMQPGEAPAGLVPGTKDDWGNIPWLNDLSAERFELQSEAVPDAKSVQTVEVSGPAGDNTFRESSQTDQELLQQARTLQEPEKECGWVCSSVKWTKDTASVVGGKISEGVDYVTNNFFTSETEAAQSTKTVVASTYGWDEGKGDSSKQALAISTKDSPATLDKNPWTFAEKTGPLGQDQRYMFTNPNTGDAVVLARLDRGPYVGGRDVDLSRQAAEAINMGKTVLPLQMTVVPSDAPLGPVGKSEYVPLPQANPLVGGSFSYGPGDASGFDNLAAYDYFTGDSSAEWATVKDNDAAYTPLASNDYVYGSNIPLPDEAPVNLPTQAEMQGELLRTQGKSTLIDYSGFQDIAGQTLPAEQVREMENQQLEARRQQADAEAAQVLEAQQPPTFRGEWATADTPAFKTALTDLYDKPAPAPDTPLSTALLEGTVLPGAQSGFTPGSATAPPEIQDTFVPETAAQNGTSVQEQSPQRETQTPPETQTAPEPAPIVAPQTPCPGPSVVDCLASRNLPTDFTSRQRLASELGISRYNGTSEQNARLLDELRTTGQSVAPTPVPAVTPEPALSAYARAAGYTGGSVTDFLTIAGRPSDFASREVLARQFNISNYVGSSQQNKQLLAALRGTMTAGLR